MGCLVNVVGNCYTVIGVAVRGGGSYIGSCSHMGCSLRLG